MLSRPSREKRKIERFEALIAHLRSGDLGWQVAAEEALRRTCDADAVVPLLRAFAVEKGEVRRTVGQMLECLGEGDLLAAVMDGLSGDPEPAVRLGDLRAAQAFAAAVLEADGGTMRAAARALARMGPDAAAHAYAAFVVRADEGTAQAAAACLARMGERGVPALLAALRTGDRQTRLDVASRVANLEVPPGLRWAFLREWARQEQDRTVQVGIEVTVQAVERALRKAPAELESASGPEGTGRELIAAAAPEGTGTEPEASAPPVDDGHDGRAGG